MGAFWVWGISRGMEFCVAHMLKTCSLLERREYLFSDIRPFSSHRYILSNNVTWECWSGVFVLGCEDYLRKKQNNSYNIEMQNLKNLSIRQSKKGEEFVILKVEVESFWKKERRFGFSVLFGRQFAT